MSGSPAEKQTLTFPLQCSRSPPAGWPSGPVHRAALFSQHRTEALKDTHKLKIRPTNSIQDRFCSCFGEFTLEEKHRLTLGLRSKKTLYLKRSRSLSSSWMSCSMRERDESSHLSVITTNQISSVDKKKKNYFQIELFRFYPALLVALSTRDSGW